MRRRFRFLVTDDADPAEQPRELFLEIPERDDYREETTVGILSAVGAVIRDWYGDEFGFQDPAVRAGTDLGEGDDT